MGPILGSPRKSVSSTISEREIAILRQFFHICSLCFLFLSDYFEPQSLRWGALWVKKTCKLCYELGIMIAGSEIWSEMLLGMISGYDFIIYQLLRRLSYKKLLAGSLGCTV